MSAELKGDALLAGLESGEVRVAERADNGEWFVNAWVKEAILDIFRADEVVPHGDGEFLDKESLTVRRFELGDGVRVVPGGSSIRRGAFVGRGVVCMPPMYINIGAWVGDGSLIDSHALVGSCAQVGKRVHVSAAAQIGGVIEPIGARPVIIEDDVFVGGGSGIYEGVCVRSGAVLGAGVILTGSTRVFDLVNESELRGSAEAPLEIPSGAVVVAGSRAVEGGWAESNGLATACAMIVKYRDDKTTRAVSLEDAIR